MKPWRFTYLWLVSSYWFPHLILYCQVIPQAICTRYGLAVGANFVWLVRILMIISYPISYPIGKVFVHYKVNSLYKIFWIRLHRVILIKYLKKYRFMTNFTFFGVGTLNCSITWLFCTQRANFYSLFMNSDAGLCTWT